MAKSIPYLNPFLTGGAYSPWSLLNLKQMHTHARKCETSQVSQELTLVMSQMSQP